MSPELVDESAVMLGVQQEQCNPETIGEATALLHVTKNRVLGEFFACLPAIDSGAQWCSYLSVIAMS